MRFQERLVGDPLPFRHGAWAASMLTKGELAAVKSILDNIEYVNLMTAETNPDTWTAFVSLLRGGYIRETFPDSGWYALTDKGAMYRRQLREVK